MEQIDDDVVIDVCHELLMRFTNIGDMVRPVRMIRLARYEMDGF